MYRTAYPSAGGTRRSATDFPFGLARIVHRRFNGGTARLDDDFSVRHFSDLTKGYGVAYRRDIAERAAANTFTTMAMDLLGTAAEPDEPVEIVIVAHVTPDADCRLAATTYLTHALPATALVFSISDNGPSTPYTALCLAGDYARRHGYQRALVLVMDQATLPYDTGEPRHALAGDAAVAILLRRGDPTGLALRQVTAVRPDGVAATIERVLREVAGPDEPVAMIAGTGIDPDRDLPARAEVVWCAPSGYPGTATWEGLAQHFGAHAGGRLVLADYDRDAGDLSICVID
jgi:hypothetical protein